MLTEMVGFPVSKLLCKAVWVQQSPLSLADSAALRIMPASPFNGSGWIAFMPPQQPVAVLAGGSSGSHTHLTLSPFFSLFSLLVSR
ncbi:hypothetical protein, partial [Pseudomonas syringae]|uniref:hypothetical protein n=1 Tax=Pseudomonas syringae TaxID=317 RepID=UPI001F31EACB